MMALPSGLPTLDELLGRMPAPAERSCRVCSCTQANACVHPEHGPCWWIEDNLCSHCGEPRIVMGDYDAMLQAGPVEPAELDAWAKRARAALEHVSRVEADLFEL